MNRKAFLLAGTLLLLTACDNYRETRAVRRTLDFAGENRPELERVLEHYSDDPLRLAAARHLIAGMKDLHYPMSSGIDSIKAVLMDVSKNGAVSADRKERWRSYRYNGDARVIHDAKNLKSQYLIENIDLAFEAWERWPWCRYYSFDDFCDYVLPYRVGNEVPDCWRRIYAERFSSVLDSLYSGSDVVVAVDSLISYVYKNQRPFFYVIDYAAGPNLGGEFLLDYPAGTCREETDFVTYLLRSVGIPVVTDMYVYSPETFMGHSWNVFKDTTGQFIPVEYGRMGVSREWTNSRAKGKVYRGEKDVTVMYYPSNKVILSHLGIGLRGGYIGVFSQDGWVPIGTFGRTLLGRAVVRNIEGGQIYQPLVKNARGFAPAGYSFILDEDGSVMPFVPDKDHLQSVLLLRKHPLTQFWTRVSHDADSVSLYGSIDGHSWILLNVSNTPEPITRERRILPDSDVGNFRYLKLSSADGRRLNIAEIEVFEDADGAEPIQLKINDAPDPFGYQPEFSADKAFDGENLTRFESAREGVSIVFELEKACRIGRIDYAPRNDDNYIARGDSYELFYQDGTRGWVSLGERIADTEWLEYDNVPAGALLWLHDYTKGLEEQVFRWVDGRQIFKHEE